MLQKDSQQVIFQEIAAFLEKRCGLYFPEADLPGLAGRIMERIQAAGAQSPAQYLQLIATFPEGADELQQLLNLITINETFFFRVPAHFRLFTGEILSHLMAARAATKQIRIWSAGCATGEEVYSLAVCMLDQMMFKGWDIRIVGTDISEQAVARARRGIYRGRTIRTVPPGLLARYFNQQKDEFQVGENVRAICEFRVHNLLNEPPPGSRFDAVLFRNVMIYFQKDASRVILEKIHRILPSDGFLIIGPAETLWQMRSDFHPHYRGDCFVYRKFPPVTPAAASPAAPPARLGTVAWPRPAGAAPIPAGEIPAIPPARPSTNREQLGMVVDYLESGGYPEALNILGSLPETVESLYFKCVASASLGDEAVFLAAKDRLLLLDPLHLETRYLWALFLSGKGRPGQARQELQKILFVNENLLLARYLLLLLLDKEGLKSQARHEGQTLIKVIESGRGTGFTNRLFTREITGPDILRHCRELIRD